MKQSTRIVMILFLSLFLFSSCKNWKEVEKKDRKLEVMIQELPFEKELLILETTHRYLFQRFEEKAIEEAEYKIQFGEKKYFVVRDNEEAFPYALEDNQLDYYLMVSIKKIILAPTGAELSVMVVKKMEDLSD